ncbi:MAG: archaemetzincin family Zn-dependent metalloprotease [Bryobacteraceae bacterium]|nr:archaemetzincin family Zn-dependent metalloprotease [Bryobacteraceae bacterium]
MIHLVAVGPDVPLERLDRLAAALAKTLGMSCRVRDAWLDPAPAYDPSRGQFHSTAILQSMVPAANGSRLLGVADVDLFVPILTYVFGEAQLGGQCALVSMHRLHEAFYGLPPDDDILHQRLAKEALHELGHTWGLKHCSDWRCAMASTHAVERLDLKELAFCRSCRTAIG